MTREELYELGFEEMPHSTIGKMLIKKLTNNRELSIGSVGTPNEHLAITEADPFDYKKITDVVMLHNFDYDGLLTIERLKLLIDFFNPFPAG